VADACWACSVVDGLCGDRLEPGDQLVEFVRGEHVARRCRQLVGEGLDPLADLPACVGEPLATSTRSRTALNVPLCAAATRSKSDMRKRTVSQSN
jgi:hypothetical protein